MKNSFSLFMVLISVNAFSYDLNEYLSQQPIINTICIKYEGTIHINYSFDINQIKKDSTYISQSLQGGIPASPEQVQKWYEYLTIKNRSFNIGYIFTKKENGNRILYSTPEGTAQPWATLEERIVNGPNEILMDHVLKFANISDNKNLDVLFNSKINPIYFTYPSCLSSNIKNIVDFKQQENLIKFKIINPSIHSERMAIVDILVDSERNNVAKKTKIEFFSDKDVSYIYLAEMDNYYVYNGILFPSSINVMFWKRLPNVSLNHLYVSGDSDILIPNKVMDIYDTTYENAENYHIKYSLLASDISINNDIEDNILWPEIPEGYKYNDFRSRYDSIRKNRTLPEEETKKVRGIGPHTLDY